MSGLATDSPSGNGDRLNRLDPRPYWVMLLSLPDEYETYEGIEPKHCRNLTDIMAFVPERDARRGAMDNSVFETKVTTHFGALDQLTRDVGDVLTASMRITTPQSEPLATIGADLRL